ncbi:hypothetical protein MCOR19_009778 [Pyricularia oryzae]|nr:hypothetical protein MCOR19_009778 [Pyricularia oryzae]
MTCAKAVDVCLDHSAQDLALGFVESRKRRREEEEEDEEEDEGEGEGHPRRSVNIFTRVHLVPVVCGLTDSSPVRLHASGVRGRFWPELRPAIARISRARAPVLAGRVLRAAGTAGAGIPASLSQLGDPLSAPRVQLLRNVVTYHFRDWTESQTKELAAFQAKRTPAPEPVIRASGVPVVPQGAQVVSPNGAQAASGVALVGGMPAVVAATLNGRPITGTYFVSFPGGAGAGQ